MAKPWGSAVVTKYSFFKDHDPITHATSRTDFWFCVLDRTRGAVYLLISPASRVPGAGKGG